MSERRRLLHLAVVEEPVSGLPNNTLVALYVVYATSRKAAEKAIRSARHFDCTIEFRDHRLPVDHIVTRLGLEDGVAKPLS